MNTLFISKDFFSFVSLLCLFSPFPDSVQFIDSIYHALLFSNTFFCKAIFFKFISLIYLLFSLISIAVKQGPSQPHSPGWARVPLSSFYLKFQFIFLVFPQTFTYFLPHFGPPGGRVPHPGRPWLRHCCQVSLSIVYIQINFSLHLFLQKVSFSPPPPPKNGAPHRTG